MAINWKHYYSDALLRIFARTRKGKAVAVGGAQPKAASKT
jgi:hypothetical protein